MILTYYYEYISERRAKYIETYRENPNYSEYERKKLELERNKNKLIEDKNKLNTNIYDCLLNGINHF